jgi:hypothetical protein
MNKYAYESAPGRDCGWALPSTQQTVAFGVPLADAGLISHLGLPTR